MTLTLNMGKITVLLCLCVTLFVLNSADISADDVYDILSSKLDNVYFDIKNLRSDIKEITENNGPTGQSHDKDNVTDLKKMFDIFKNEINNKFSSLEETLKKDVEKYFNELSIPESFNENRYALITGKTLSAEKKLIRRKLAEMEQKLEYRTKEAEGSIEEVLKILKFEKDKCEVPYDGMDGRLTLTNDQSVSLSGGSDVESGTFVYFDCSKADQPIYEPSNRRFKCVKRGWIEADKDLDWNFGNEGAFPKCRKAICEPNCAHGGICVKDNSCQCPDYTEGERCERHICDVKCLENGGLCIGPGECECHEGRYGPNCEHEYCVLPNNAAKPKNSKTKYSAGETLTAFTCDDGFVLSSNGGMTCVQNGMWSEIVTCQKAVHYIISVKTGSIVGAGTDANVYVTLQGMNGTTERIEFQGSFERDELNEISIQARYIRPVKSIVIGFDGSAFSSDWFVAYASIYIENMEEYYVFRYNGWVNATNDVVIQSEGDCISSFDEGHFWRVLRSTSKRAIIFNMESGHSRSLRECKQACVIKEERCVGIQYYSRTCIGFAVNQTRYFDDYSMTKTSSDKAVYLRTCK